MMDDITQDDIEAVRFALALLKSNPAYTIQLALEPIQDKVTNRTLHLLDDLFAALIQLKDELEQTASDWSETREGGIGGG